MTCRLKSYFNIICVLTMCWISTFTHATYSEIGSNKTELGMDSLIERSVNLSNGNDSIEMNYIKTGSGSIDLILLHGLGSNLKAWKKISPILSEDFTLYAIDLPKYLDREGKTNVSMMSYAAHIISFCKQMGIESANIVGHSMGGQVAIHTGLLAPDLIQSLILLAPAGIEEFSEFDRKWFSSYVTKEYYLSLSESKIKQLFDINFNGNKTPMDAQFMIQDRIDIMADSLRYSRYVDYLIAAVQAMLDEPVKASLDELRMPTLLLFGKNDQLIPNRILHPKTTVHDLMDECNTLIRDVETHIIDDAGHFLQWDQAERVADSIRSFISKFN